MTTYFRIFFYINIFILLLETHLYSEEKQTVKPDAHIAKSEKNTPPVEKEYLADKSDLTNDSTTIDTSKSKRRHPTFNNIRGLENAEEKPDDVFRRISSGILYPFRQVINGIFLIASKSAALALDDEFRSKVENLIYFYEENETRVGWFPVVTYSSGPRFRLGAALFFKNDIISTNIKAYWGGDDYWSTMYHLSNKYTLGPMEWNPTFEAQLTQKDKLEFYGIGPKPKEDTRSHFLSGSKDLYGVFTQEKRLIIIKTPVTFFDNWYVHYIFLYQMRKIKSGGYKGPPLGAVFDLTALPGGNFSQPVEHIYNEVDCAYDSRNLKKIHCPGWRIEWHAGIVKGVDRDNSFFARAGSEVSAFIPIIKGNRLLIPRVNLYVTENLSDQVAIPFSEYSRHHSFRGTGSKKIIRSDNWSVMSSLEYQWPLNHFMAGHIYFDHLAIGPHLKKLGWRDGLYVGGIGINLHNKKKELGRFLIGYGSEKFRVLVSLGFPSHINSRENW